MSLLIRLPVAGIVAIRTIVCCLVILLLAVFPAFPFVFFLPFRGQKAVLRASVRGLIPQCTIGTRSGR